MQPLQQPHGAAASPKFKVLKALGKGSYGTVYKVQRLADGGVYAMKETDLGRQGPKERSDAVNEIRLLGSLAHPNVVRHHETFLSGNKLCIVMEYAPAGDLASFIRAAAASKLPLPEAVVWQIFLQLCQGMQAIHETCVIHRDLKPANIFMAPDNVVKIGDLGVAKALNRANYAQTTIGTPVFMAPEVWRGLRYAYSSDLWSLGGVLYEMMTYRLPFDGRSLSELKHKIILGSFAPLVPGAPYSGALVALVHALLSKDPDRRPTCAAILNSTEAAPWLHTIPDAVRLPLPPLDHGRGRGGSGAGAAGSNPLLPTIFVPRDIRLLPHHLPKPSYESEQQQVAGGQAGGAAPLSPGGFGRAAPVAGPAAVLAAMAGRPAAGAAGAMPSPGRPPVMAAAPSPRGLAAPYGGVAVPAVSPAGRPPSGGGWPVRLPSGGGRAPAGMAGRPPMAAAAPPCAFMPAGHKAAAAGLRAPAAGGNILQHVGGPGARAPYAGGLAAPSAAAGVSRVPSAKAPGGMGLGAGAVAAAVNRSRQQAAAAAYLQPAGAGMGGRFGGVPGAGVAFGAAHPTAGVPSAAVRPAGGRRFH